MSTEYTWNFESFFNIYYFYNRRTEEKDIAMPPESFFTRLKRLLTEQQPNWIFDYQRKVSQQMIFYNRQLTTIRIVVNYQIEDLVEESTISVCSIQLDNDVPTPKDQWSSREHFLNFHLSLRLPMNPSDEIEGSDETAFLKFLNGIDRRIAEVKQKLHKVLDLLAQKRARLTRYKLLQGVSQYITNLSDPFLEKQIELLSER